MEYYPAGYYPTETWHNEESWEEETAEETHTQNEQGQNSEAQKEEAGSVQGGEFCSLERGHTQMYDLCELKTTTPKVVPPPRRGVLVPPPNRRPLPQWPLCHGGWLDPVYGGGDKDSLQKVPNRLGNQPREIARVFGTPMQQSRLSIFETPNPWKVLDSTTSDIQSPEPVHEHITKSLVKTFGKFGTIFGSKTENKGTQRIDPPVQHVANAIVASVPLRAEAVEAKTACTHFQDLAPIKQKTRELSKTLARAQANAHPDPLSSRDPVAFVPRCPTSMGDGEELASGCKGPKVSIPAEQKTRGPSSRESIQLSNVFTNGRDNAKSPNCMAQDRANSPSFYLAEFPKLMTDLITISAWRS